MKIHRLLPLLVTLFLTSFLILPKSIASPFTISEQEINHYLQTRLAEKIPLQDKIGIPMLLELDYHLHNLSTQIGQTEQKRVEIAGIIEGTLMLRGKSRNAQIHLNLDTLPYFDAEKGAIFLKDARLLSWQVSPQKYQNELQSILPMLSDGLSNLLNHYPVYTLDDSKMKEALVKKFGKAIIVEKGQLRLETSIF